MTVLGSSRTGSSWVQSSGEAGITPAIMAKAGFGISVYVLFAQGRLGARNLLLPSIDLVLAALFAWAYVALRSDPPTDGHC